MSIHSMAIEGKDRSLAAACESHRLNQAAFREFYTKTAPALRSYVSRNCGSYDLAEDIMQEAFLRFLRAAPTGMDEAGMKGYLYRTADSILIDHWRRLKRSRRWSLETFFGKKPQPDPRNRTDMTDAFRELKAQHRSLLWLAYVEGFDHREIAAATGLNEKSVRVLLFRARKALTAILEGK